MIPPRFASRIEAHLFTAITDLHLHRLFSIPSRSPHSLTPTSWDHLPGDALHSVLVSGSAFRRTQIQTLVKLVYFSSPARKMLLFIHVHVHSFIPDEKFKAQSG